MRGSRLLLATALLAVYRNSFTGAFLIDDYSCIQDNPAIRSLWPLARFFSTPSDLAVAGRPVASLSLALNYAVGGLDVVGYHLVNLIIHLLATLVLFGLVRRTLRSEPLRGRWEADADGLACAAALLWAVHPLVTESVTYIVQRTESLMGLWVLLTLYSVARSATADHPHRWHVAAIASCALGMGTKEVMVSAPLLAWLYDRTFLAGSFREALRQRRGLYVGLAATWLILLALLVANPRPLTAGWGAAAMTPWAYAMTQCGVILHYLRLAVWPHPLVVDYGDWPIASTLHGVLPSAIVVAGLLGLTVWALRAHPALGFLGAWIFLILAPTSSVWPVTTELLAERRMYLLLCGLVILAVMGTWTLLGRFVREARIRRRIAAGLLMVTAAALGVLTVRRNADYRSEIVMLRDVLAKRPANARIHQTLGIALVEQGALQEAAGAFRDALRLQPDYAEAHNNLGVILETQGRVEEARAQYLEAARLRPDLELPRRNLARLRVVQSADD